MTYPFRRAGAVLAFALLASGLVAAEADKKTFNVPAGAAEVTLREFTKQANVQLVFDSDKVTGIRTAAVQGEATPRAALDRMFAGTGLVAEQDKVSGAFTVRRETPGEAKKGASRPTGERTAPSAEKTSSDTVGVVTGRVSNAATRAYLEHAEVRVAGTTLVAETDREGRFTLAAVPAGSQVLVVTYTGLDETKQPVTVRVGEPTAVDIALSSAIYTLNAFVVASDREGRSEAIASQRRAQNLKKVVASDEFGNLSEGNVGEVLRNLPGIDMEFSGTDPQTMKVRGIDAALTGFTIDGNNYANAASSGANRKFELEAMAVQNVEKVEVNMAPTPAQDGTAIGGSINLVSRGPFGQKGRRLSLALSATTTSQHPQIDRVYFPDKLGKRWAPQAGGTLLYSETFGPENKFGVVLTFSQSHKMSFTDQANRTWDYPGTAIAGRSLEDPSYTYLRSYNGGVGGNDVRRLGASLNLAYRLSPHTTLSLNNQWNDFYNRLRGATLAFAINQGSIAAGANENRVEALPTTNANTNVQLNGTGFNKYTENWSFNPGVKHTFGPWAIDYDGAFSKSVNHYRTTDQGFFNSISTRLQSGIGFIVEGAPNSPSPKITQTAGADFLNPNSYTTLTTAGRSNHSRDDIYAAKFNVRRNFAGKWPAYLQAGGKFVQDDRWITQPNRSWTYVGPDGVRGNADDNQNYGRLFVDPNVDYPHTFLRSPPTGWLDVHRAYDYFLQNPQAFQEDLVAAYTNYVRNRRFFYERVMAGYAMGSVTLGRLNLLGGARFEHTDVGGVGFQQRTNAAINAIPDLLERAKAQYGGPSLRSNSHYADLLPNLQANYRFSSNFVVRAAATQALGRPQLDQIIPNITVTEPTGSGIGTINLVKAGLKPQHSTNYDLSIEYYFEPVGVLSAGLFRREIKDYIASITTPVTADTDLELDGNFVGYNLTQRLNAGRSIQEGLELSYSQQLSFLPGWAKGFGVLANVTFITGNTELSGQPKIYEVPNIVPRIYNLGINYRHRLFSARVKLNVRSAYVTNIPGASGQKNFRGQQAQVAANFDAALARRLKLTLDVNNVFNEQPYSYTTKQSRMTNKGTWGAYITLGLKYDL